MDAEKKRWLRWRWEFLRKNREFRLDYKRHQSLTESAKDNEAAHNLCAKWGVEKIEVLNPDLSFDELIKPTDPNINKKFHELLVFSALCHGPITVNAPFCSEEMTEEHETLVFLNGPPPRELVIKIDLNKVRRKDALKKEVLKIIDQHFEMVKNLNRLRSEGDRIACAIPEDDLWQEGGVNKTDYDLILLIGELKEKKLTNEEIARKLYPHDFSINNYKGNQDSKVRLVSKFYQRYQYMVKDGFRYLSVL